MPSTHQRSGRFESCNSILISPVAAATSFTSPLTNGSQASSSFSVARRPMSRSRSLREMEIVGMDLRSVLDAFGADHLEVGRKEVADVVNLECHHRHAIETQSPRNDGYVDTQRLRHFRTQESGTAQLHPAQTGMAHVQFHRGFGEWEVGREEFTFLSLRDLRCKQG